MEEKGVDKISSNVRRAFAAEFPTKSQKQDRLGRDVAFFIDAVSEAGLIPEERQAWRQRGQFSVANVGLSDIRDAPKLNPVSDTHSPSFNQSLEPIPHCPQSVLNPRAP